MMYIAGLQFNSNGLNIVLTTIPTAVLLCGTAACVSAWWLGYRVRTQQAATLPRRVWGSASVLALILALAPLVWEGPHALWLAWQDLGIYAPDLVRTGEVLYPLGLWLLLMGGSFRLEALSRRQKQF